MDVWVVHARYDFYHYSEVRGVFRTREAAIAHVLNGDHSVRSTVTKGDSTWYTSTYDESYEIRRMTVQS